MIDKTFKTPSPLQPVEFNSPHNNIELFIKRDDLIHPDISGNKWRKLKLNIEQAKHKRKNTILTFGGAHSNHIAATAKTANLFGMESIGIIRGEEADLLNPTLDFALKNGMKIHRVSRTEYKDKATWDYKESLKETFGDFFLIPEGGANYYGVQGCMEIMNEIYSEQEPDRIFLACGTATTISGIAIANSRNSIIHGVSVLKGGEFLNNILEENLFQIYGDKESVELLMEKVEINLDFHFGGYAKVKPNLINFMKDFYIETGVKLDPVYTAKAAFAMKELSKTITKKEKWVFLHTGGLQGIAAMEDKLGVKIY